jgi:prolyl oligopeptidase
MTIKIFSVLVLCASSVAFAQPAATPFQAPATSTRTVVDLVHGVRLPDPYRWLEDKASADVQAWTRAQNDATLAWMRAAMPEVPGLREDLQRYVDRTIISAPWFYKGQVFFTRKQKGEAQAKLLTRIQEKEVLVLDPVALDPTGKTSLGTIEHSPHGPLLAVAVQRAGAEVTDIHFVHSETGAVMFPPLVGATQVSFAATPGTIYVTPRTRALIDTQQPLHAYTLKLGEPIDRAQRVLENDDAKNWLSVRDDERSPHTLYSRGDFWSRTFTIAPAQSGASPVILFSSKKARADVELVGRVAYLRTNEDAPNWKLMRADLSDLRAIKMTTLLPESSEAGLKGFAVTTRHVITREKRNLAHELRLYGLDGKPDASRPVLTPPEFGDVSGVRYDHHSDVLYVSLATFNAPSTLYRVDPHTFVWTRIFQDASAISTEDITTQQVSVPTRDGKSVPVFVSMKKGTLLDGQRPVLLYGYGGFNNGISVSYLGTFAALINRGVVFVHAGIRGGDEYGETWHQDGMLAKKQNSFNDFIDVAQWLIANGYTKPSKLAIMGGSNGGLLVGAVATQRPDLFKAVVCQVPLLDMVRYQKFQIARFWIPEYGDAEKEADFRTLLSYSPYHAIRMGVELPAMLVTAGENDTRVDPLHAKKFVARAQANVGQSNPVLLKMDFDSGHGSGKSTQQLIDDREVWIRFVLRSIVD